jgi:DNA-directed RNA polymerase subunit M/transcription elongation factor TFIIS
MVLFCPYCANVLLVEAGPENRLRFFCNTCPYVFGIDQKISKKAALERKQVDDILGDEVFENAQQTEGSTSLRSTIYMMFIIIIYFKDYVCRHLTTSPLMGWR